MSAREQLPPLIITFLVVDIIAVALRIWIRTHIKKSFGFDDGALCIALVRARCFTATRFLVTDQSR